MEPLNFSGLKAILNFPTSPQHPNTMKPHHSASSTTITNSAYDDLSLSSVSLSPPPLSDLSLETNPEKDIRGSSEEANPRKRAGRSWWVDLNTPWTTGKVYPPPISCLSLVRTGKPFSYLRFNEDDNSFAVETIRIPSRDILRASRSNGRLKLYFVQSDDEEEEEREEEEEEEEKSG